MRIFILFFAGLLVALIGCGEKVSNPNPADNRTPTTAEIPDVAKDMLDNYLNENDEAAAYAWWSNLDSNAVDIACHSEAFAITFLWGDLFGTGSSATVITDWSGTLNINAVGSIRVRHIIDFEDGQDSVLITDVPTVSAWVSATNMDLDGLSFIVTARTDVQYFMAPVLTFETAPITLHFNLFDLIQLDTFYMADNRNGVAVHSRRIWQNSCPGGTITGQWIKYDNTGDTGFIYGYWLNYNGDTLGIMSGTFGGPATNDTPWRQFRGSVSGLYLDVVLFEFNGFWYYDDARECAVCGQGHGRFWGKFIDLMNSRRGLIAGQFGDYSLPPNDVILPLTGYWQYHCPWATYELFDY